MNRLRRNNRLGLAVGNVEFTAEIVQEGVATFEEFADGGEGEVFGLAVGVANAEAVAEC